MCSGEALPAELARASSAAAGELHNLYGPTEAAVEVTARPCVRGATASPIPIGRPIANMGI